LLKIIILGINKVTFVISDLLQYYNTAKKGGSIVDKKDKKKISPPHFEMPDVPRWVSFFVLGLILLVIIGALTKSSTRQPLVIPPSEFEQKIAIGTIELSSVSLKIGNKVSEISGFEKDQNQKVRAKMANDSDAYKRLIVQSEKFGKGVEERKNNGFRGTISTYAPWLVAGVVFVLFFWFVKGHNGGIPGLNRRRNPLRKGELPTTRFKDVGGVDEARGEVEDIVQFLQNPQKFNAMGAKIPKGVLLTGQPGTGKTHLARAVAGEAGVPFFHISASEFVEMYVGLGAKRVRELFDRAKRNAPAIVFVDEIDAVGRHRGSGVGVGHDEREQTLNQILVEMDGFKTATDETKVVIVIAATNRPDILDPALLRPGRFDRKVTLTLPDIIGRKAILDIHKEGKPLEDSVSLERIAQETPGFSGADLANVLNESALLAIKRSKTEIGEEEILDSIDKVLAGPERKTRIISPKEKKIIAYHEAGHAVVAWAMPHGDPVRKISIVSRDTMLGWTKIIPVADRYVYLKGYFDDLLSINLGGRVAEELYCDDVTTGACKDLEQATALALKVIKECGMSKALGLRTFGHKNEVMFLGREMLESKGYSEETARKIDEEVDALLNNAESRAREALIAHKEKVHDIVRALIVSETLQDEALRIFLPEK
jgi:cell division protease FtsH